MHGRGVYTYVCRPPSPPLQGKSNCCKRRRNRRGWKLPGSMQGVVPLHSWGPGIHWLNALIPQSSGKKYDVTFEHGKCVEKVALGHSQPGQTVSPPASVSGTSVSGLAVSPKSVPLGTLAARPACALTTTKQRIFF